MGIRMTQDYGLHESARKFLEEFCERTGAVECPTCHHKTGGDLISRIWEDNSHLGMFDDGPALREYTLKSGSKVKEFIQAEPWSSGPMFYLCLKDEHENVMFPWPEEEIEGGGMLYE